MICPYRDLPLQGSAPTSAANHLTLKPPHILMGGSGAMTLQASSVDSLHRTSSNQLAALFPFASITEGSTSRSIRQTDPNPRMSRRLQPAARMPSIAAAALPMVSAMSLSLWALLINAASNWLGAK